MNNPKETLTVAPPSASAGQALKRVLDLQGIGDWQIVTPTDGSVFRLTSVNRTLELSAPVRLGVLLENLRALSVDRQQQVLSFGPYTLDLLGRTWSKVRSECAAVELTGREVALLEALILAPGHRLDRAQLLRHVWGYHEDTETHTLETHIYRLRRKIESDAAQPHILITEGAGYRLSV